MIWLAFVVVFVVRVITLPALMLSGVLLPVLVRLGVYRPGRDLMGDDEEATISVRMPLLTAAGLVVAGWAVGGVLAYLGVLTVQDSVVFGLIQTALSPFATIRCVRV
jgi:hypothetical protein